MASLHCLCGETVSLSEYPNIHEFPLFSDQQLEQLQELLASSIETSLSKLQRLSIINKIFVARSPHPEMIECPSCGRIALFRNMSDETPAVWYTPEVVNHPVHSKLNQLFSCD